MKGMPMARYMVQAAYTPAALAAFARAPQDRQATVAALAERFEGKLITFDYCMGDYDVVIIFEAPDDTAAIATALVANSPGHLRTYKTTKLFTQEEMMEASRKAGQVTFQGPSAR